MDGNCLVDMNYGVICLESKKLMFSDSIALYDILWPMHAPSVPRYIHKVTVSAAVGGMMFLI